MAAFLSLLNDEQQGTARPQPEELQHREAEAEAWSRLNRG